MANKLYLVVHPKQVLNVKLEGDEKKKPQSVPKGTVVSMNPNHVENLVAKGRLELHVAEDEPELEEDNSENESDSDSDDSDK